MKEKIMQIAAVMVIGSANAGAAAFVTLPSRTQHMQPTIRIEDKKGAFISTLTAAKSLSNSNSNNRRDVSVGLFSDLFRKGKDQGENGDEVDESDKGKVSVGDEQLVEKEEQKRAIPFFASNFLETIARKTTASSSEDAQMNRETSFVPGDDKTTKQSQQKPQEKTPEQIAEQLRAQAARIRLEAEKRQVELTLEKIEKLNSQLEHMKAADDVDVKSQKSLEEQLQRLKSQLITNEKGEIKPANSNSSTPPIVDKVFTSTPAAAAVVVEVDTPLQSEAKPSLSSEDLKERVQKFEEAPEFMRILVAKIAGYGVDERSPGAVNRLNASDIILKLYDDNIGYEDIIRRQDFTDESEREQARNLLERVYEQSGGGDNNEDSPKFTKEQIQEKMEELDQIPTFLKSIYSKEFNDTEMAIMLLEEEYTQEKNKKRGGFFGLFGSKEKGDIGKERIDAEGTGKFSRLFSPGDTEKNENDLSFMIESLYPKSTRKEGQTPDKRLVDVFMNDVVAATNLFIPSSDKISVPGGWVR
jgi:hypothetical protein